MAGRGVQPLPCRSCESPKALARLRAFSSARSSVSGLPSGRPRPSARRRSALTPWLPHSGRSAVRIAQSLVAARSGDKALRAASMARPCAKAPARCPMGNLGCPADASKSVQLKPFETQPSGRQCRPKSPRRSRVGRVSRGDEGRFSVESRHARGERCRRTAKLATAIAIKPLQIGRW